MQSVDCYHRHTKAGGSKSPLPPFFCSHSATVRKKAGWFIEQMKREPPLKSTSLSTRDSWYVTSCEFSFPHSFYGADCSESHTSHAWSWMRGRHLTLQLFRSNQWRIPELSVAANTSQQRLNFDTPIQLLVATRHGAQIGGRHLCRAPLFWPLSRLRPLRNKPHHPTRRRVKRHSSQMWCWSRHGYGLRQFDCRRFVTTYLID